MKYLNSFICDLKIKTSVSLGRYEDYWIWIMSLTLYFYTFSYFIPITTSRKTKCHFLYLYLRKPGLTDIKKLAQDEMIIKFHHHNTKNKAWIQSHLCYTLISVKTCSALHVVCVHLPRAAWFVYSSPNSSFPNSGTRWNFFKWKFLNFIYNVFF